MRKFNISDEQVEMIVKYGSKLVLGAFALALLRSKRIDIPAAESRTCETTYSDAVSAILNSSMFDSNKTKLMIMLKRDGDSEYYKSVIMTINSSMFDSNKIQTVEGLSAK